MCWGCICGDDHTNRPWWPSEQRFDCPADETFVTDCCLRKLPASETVARLRTQELPAGGFGNYQEPDELSVRPQPSLNWFSHVSYYDSTWRIECNPEGELSCKQHKRFMRGLHLREWRYEAA